MLNSEYRRQNTEFCLSTREILEPRVLAYEGELHDAGWSVALFADNDLGHPSFSSFGSAPVNEQDDVGVLLQGARFAEVGKLGPVVGSRLRRAAQLRERDDRHVELLGEPFKDREMDASSCWRFSKRPRPCISWM